MSKIISLFAGLVIRVLILAIVSCWASSRMFVIVADMGVRIPGIQGIGVMSTPHGLLVTALDRAVITNSFQIVDADSSPSDFDWNEIAGPARKHWSVLSIGVWLRTRQSVVQVGMPYPTALVLLLISYWWTRRLGRRKRIR
ncbi:MAG: hypothetical protein GY826_26610 [Fuerstiella sp.]|nr:hypothetical protein [Fuerstiella sp.]MCP4786772.1 hypothetical protein [Fuerstiella sp.]